MRMTGSPAVSATTITASNDDDNRKIKVTTMDNVTHPELKHMTFSTIKILVLWDNISEFLLL